MAGNAGTAVFEAIGRFGGLIRESDKATDALGRTRRAGQEFGREMPADGGPGARGLRMTARRADELSQKLNTTGKDMSLKVTAPIALVGVTAVRSFANFEKSLTAANLKAGGTEEQFKRMKTLALDLGASTVFSAQDAADGLDLMAAAGFNAEQAMAALPGVMLAAQASGEDVALVADTVAKAINAFGLEAKDAGRVADIFTQAANTSALDVRGIAEAMAYTGEIGSRFGQDMEGVVAVLSRLVDQGVPAASAGQALRTSLTRLAGGTPKVSKLLKTLGIEVRDANGEMKQLPDIMAELDAGLSSTNPKFKAMNRGFGESEQETRDWALTQLFGVESAKAFALALGDGKPFILDTQKETEKMDALTKGLSETMGKKAARAFIKARTENGKFTATGADAVKALDAMNRSSEGVAKKFGDAFGKTTYAQLQNLIESLANLGITIVDKISPALEAFLKGANAVVDVLSKLLNIPGVGPLVAGLLLMAAAIGPVLIGLAALLKLYSKVKAAAGALRGIGKRAPPPVYAPEDKRSRKGGGGRAAGGAVYWTRPMPVYLVNGRKGGPVVPPGGREPTKPGGRRANGPAVILGGGKYRGDHREGGGTRRREGRASLFGVGGGDRRGGRGFKGNAKIAGGGLAAGGAALATGVALGGDPKETAKQVAVFGAMSAAMSVLGKIFAAVIPVVARFGPVLLRIAPMVLRFLGPIGLLISIAILVVQHWDTVKSALIATWKAIQATATVVWNQITATISGAVKAVSMIVKAVIAALVAFWKIHWLVAKAVVTGAWAAIRAVVTAAVRAVAAVVRAVIGAVVAFWRGSWNTARAVVAGAWAAMRAIVSGAMNAIRSAVSSGFSAVLSVVRAVPGRIKSALGNVGTLLLQAGKDVMAGLGRGIASGAQAVVEKAKGVAGSVLGGIKSAFKIGSPSRITTQYGKWVAQGLRNGLASGEAGLRKMGIRLSNAVKKAVSTKEITKAEGKNLQAFIDNRIKALNGLAKKVEQVQRKIKELREERAQKAESVSQGISGELDLGSTVGDNGYGRPTFGSVAGIVSSMAARAKKFAGKITALRKKGIAPGLVDEVAALGTVKGIPVADALLSGSRADVKKLNADYKAIGTYSDKIGNSVAGGLFDAGLKAQQGLLRGLLNQKTIDKAARDLARRLPKAVRKALGIHSPSIVMDRETGFPSGQGVGRGVIRGLNSSQDAINARIRDLVDPDLVDWRSLMSGAEATSAVSGGLPSLNDLPTQQSAMVNSKASKVGDRIWAPVINNPVPERASSSMFRTMQKAAYLGLDGEDDL